MQIQGRGEAALRLNTRLTATAGLLAASVLTNLLMAGLVMGARQTILVPMLPASVTLSSTGEVSYDYLEATARDAAYLFLNRTPDNTDYFEQQLLRIADPTTYQAIRAALSDARRHTLSGHVSQTFIPSDWYVDPRRLYVEVAGVLTQSNGTQAPDQAERIYAIRFARRGSGLRLISFEAISHEQSIGQKLQITQPPPSGAAPLTTSSAPTFAPQEVR